MPNLNLKIKQICRQFVNQIKRIKLRIYENQETLNNKNDTFKQRQNEYSQISFSDQFLNIGITEHVVVGAMSPSAKKDYNQANLGFQFQKQRQTEATTRKKSTQVKFLLAPEQEKSPQVQQKLNVVTDTIQEECMINQFNFYQKDDMDDQSQVRVINTSGSPYLHPRLITNIEDKLKEQIQIKPKSNCTCKRIMSVDDEIFNQKSIQLLLNRIGYEVIQAYDGQEALIKVKHQERCCFSCSMFTIILMDYQMPVMNGVECTEALIHMMDDGLIPQIPVIGLTAFTSKKDIDMCLASGQKYVLHKPLQFKQILTILEQIETYGTLDIS